MFSWNQFHKNIRKNDFMKKNEPLFVNVNRFEVVAKRKENYLQVGFKKIFKFDFLQKKIFFRGHSEFCCKKDKKETMWNMNLVQQNFFSASKYMCMYLQSSNIHITNAFKSFLVKSRSDCLFWFLTDRCWISDGSGSGWVPKKSRHFSHDFHIFGYPNQSLIWNGVGQVIWL